MQDGLQNDLENIASVLFMIVLHLLLKIPPPILGATFCVLENSILSLIHIYSFSLQDYGGRGLVRDRALSFF